MTKAIAFLKGQWAGHPVRTTVVAVTLAVVVTCLFR